MKLLLFFLLLVQTASGQITGKLTRADGSPLQGMDVRLIKATDSALVKETLTDEQGIYRFAAQPKGTYLIRCSGLGFEPWQSMALNLDPAYPLKDLGTQILKEHSTQLGDVVIRATRPPFQQNMYGTTVNPESSILNKGSSVLEVLERSPGVLVDHQHFSVMLNGKTDVTLMINGKLTHLPMDQVFLLLNGMNADDIEKIELLPTPPANFDAAGSGGIINIVLKKSKRKGNSASLTLSAGAGWGEKASGSVRADHNTGKMDVYASFSFSHDKTRGILSAWGSETVPSLGGPCIFWYHGDGRYLSNSQTLTLGWDDKLGKKTTVGASLLYNANHMTSLSMNQAAYNVLPDSLLQFNGRIDGSSHYDNPVGSLYIEQTFHKGETLNLGLDGIYYHTYSPTSVESSFLDQKGEQFHSGDTSFAPVQNGYSNSTIKVGVIRLDYTRSLNPSLTVDAGLKGDYTHSLSHSGILSEVNGAWISRAGTSNDILMRERIKAVYLSFHLKIDSLTTLVAGARYEASRTTATNSQTGTDTVDRVIKGIFPDIFLTRNHWVLSYTRRISRPSYADLASYIGYNDPISVFTGNPFLRPTLTSNLKLGYNNQGYGLSLLASRDLFPIARYQVSSRPGSDLVYIAPENLPFENSLTLQAIVPWKIRPWWELNFSIQGSWRQYEVDFVPHPFEKSFLTWSFNFTQTWKLPDQWTAELSGFYNALSYNATGTAYRNGQLNVGIKKDLKGGKGSLQLAATDPFRLMQYRGAVGELTQDVFLSKVQVNYQPETRFFPILRLTYTRSFGSGTAKNTRSGAEEERGRL